MKALFIGGTGTISTSVVARAMEKGWEVTLLNRGNRPLPEGAESLIGDIHDEEGVSRLLDGRYFDVVAEFVAFTPEDVQRDIRLFGGRCGQYIFISSASAYQKPVAGYPITESTPLANPYWAYSRNKAAAEETLMNAYGETGFPVTIVRPSHTYCDEKVPVAIHGNRGSWQVLRRIQQGKPVIIPGDGTSLWTMTHASDFAKGYVALMANPHALGNAYHITTDETMTWNQIHEVIAKALGTELKAVHIPSDLLALCGKQYDLEGALLGDKANTVIFDNTKIKREAPEFVCTTSMAAGITRAVQKAAAHPERQMLDPEFDAWCDRVIAHYEALCEALGG